MTIRRIGVLSLAKIVGVIHGAIGLLAGGLVAIGTLAGFGVVSGFGASDWSALFAGLSALIFLPVFYGVLGFLAGAFAGWIFNLASGVIGGLEVEVGTA